MPTSLEKLVENLPSDKFITLNDGFPMNTQLLLRKGVYPYEYITDFDKFQETSLPCHKAFYSSLTEETISDYNYKHAQNVWNVFNIKTLGNYHDLYVKVDVLQLADVLQNSDNLVKQTLGAKSYQPKKILMPQIE